MQHTAKNIFKRKEALNKQLKELEIEMYSFEYQIKSIDYRLGKKALKEALLKKLISVNKEISFANQSTFRFGA